MQPWPGPELLTSLYTPHILGHAAQVITVEGRLTEAQRREELASAGVAELREQLEQRAAEAQHCNARAEVLILRWLCILPAS